MLLIQSVFVLAATSCEVGDDRGGPQDPELPLADSPETDPGWVNPTSVYACSDPDGGSFRLVTTALNMKPGELALWLPPRFERPYEVLIEVEGFAGVQYSAEGVLFSLKDGTAALSVGGRTFEDCRQDRQASVWEHAKLSGVDFRAVGNEPGWHLEIRDDLEARAGKRIRFVYDYGQQDAVLQAPEPTVDQEARRTVYTGVNGDLSIVVEILGEACQDSMSGEQFETTVTVQFQGTTYQGCGRALH
jgi:putative lipoprotein